MCASGFRSSTLAEAYDPKQVPAEVYDISDVDGRFTIGPTIVK